MRAFEMTFELPTVSDAVEDRVVELLDATIAEHLGVLTATVLVSARDGVSAANVALERLVEVGATPVRLLDDLVSRSQIAERAGVTRQAVAHWTSGSRRADTAFPAPFVLSGGGLWLWGEVVDFLRTIDLAVGEDAAFPTRRESQIIASLLASAQAPGALVT